MAQRIENDGLKLRRRAGGVACVAGRRRLPLKLKLKLKLKLALALALAGCRCP